MGLRSNQWLLPNAYMLQCVSWLFITKTKHPRILQRGEVDWIYSFRGLDPRWFGSPGLSSDESGRRQRQNVDRRSHIGPRSRIRAGEPDLGLSNQSFQNLWVHVSNDLKTFHKTYNPPEHHKLTSYIPSYSSKI